MHIIRFLSFCLADFYVQVYKRVWKAMKSVKGNCCINITYGCRLSASSALDIVFLFFI